MVTTAPRFSEVRPENRMKVWGQYGSSSGTRARTRRKALGDHVTIFFTPLEMSRVRFPTKRFPNSVGVKLPHPIPSHPTNRQVDSENK